MQSQGIRRYGVAGLALIGIAVTLVIVAAGPASAQDENGFACRAEALRASVFENPPLLPFVAGSDTEFCTNDNGGLPAAGDAILPETLGLDAVYAMTRISDPNTAPAYQVATARSGAADARIDANGDLIRVQAVQAESKATCVDGQVRYRSTGHVARLFVFGQEIPLNDGLTMLINGIDEATQVLVHIELNEEVRTDDGGYIFRALHVTVPMDGSVLNVSVGENRLRPIGDPCHDFTGGPGGPQVPDRPVVGQPYGGGNVLDLSDVKGFRASACRRSRAFGRKIAIVGTNRRDTIVGSRFADRIFSKGGSDLVSAGRARDCIEAGGGNDKVAGDHSGDTLYGRSGKDKLDGGIGPDKLYGGAGKDRLLAGLGRDRLFGDSGADILSGRGGSDVLSGGKGNDKIYADFRGRRDRVKCGPGRDKVFVDRYDIVASDCERVGVNLSFNR